MFETLFFKLLEISIQASFFILAIIFIRLCFKRLPKRYICLLWGLVALRLLFPVQITSEFSLVPDTSRVQNLAEVEISLPQSNAAETAVALPQNNPADKDAFLSDTTHDITVVQDDIPTTNTTPSLLSTFWCFGMVLLLGYGLISYFRTKHHLREAVHDTENIWYCAGIPSPFVMGYIKPRIYIPYSVEQAELPYIIAHEKSHLAHFDHLSKLLGYVLLSIYWFNPFIWGAYFYFCKDLELACDERVILYLGDSERKAYSQALLSCSVANKALLQSPLAFSEVAVKERIINILNYKKPGFWGVLLAALACVVAVVCFMTSPEEKTNTETVVLESFPLEETIDYVDPNVSQDILTTYADQLETLPGDCFIDENNNLMVEFRVRDSDCGITTNSVTGETVYHWISNPNYNKLYPLEIKDGKVQDVPARIITENDLLELPFGEALIQMTYKVHPSGKKQYILRENSTIHVNIGREQENFINFQYLEFQISEDKQTAELTNYGSGYYLLAVMDVSGLEAFRADFTGNGHLIPSDSTHLPWEWLGKLNGEQFVIPQLKQEDIPIIEHLPEYPFTFNNILDFWNGFILDEIWENGEPYAEYHYQDGTDDIIILTDKHGEIISLTFNGLKKEWPSNIDSSFSYFDIHAGGGGHHSIPYYMDVTSDGKKEFFLDTGSGGTGVWDNDCIIFNLDTMEQLTFDKNILDITSQLQVSLTEFVPEEGKLTYRLEYNGQSGVSEMGFSHNKEIHASMLEPGVTLEEADEYFSYTPAEKTRIIGYDSEKNCFKMETWIWTNNTYPAQYIGELTADYVWDTAINQFVIDLDTVKLNTY